MAAIQGALKVTGTGVSALDGSAQRVPFYTTVFNTSSWSVGLSGVSGITLPTAGVYKLDAAVEFAPVPDLETTYVLDLRKNGVLETSAGFGAVNKLGLSQSRINYGVINYYTLRASSLVSATANSVVDVFFTGQPNSSATTQRLSIVGPFN